MKNKKHGWALPVLLALALSAGPGRAQTQEPAPLPTPAPSPAPTPAPSPMPTPATGTPTLPGLVRPGMPEPGEPRPYAQIITADAKTQNGLFRVHNVKTRLYFEIPKELLEQPLLMAVNATAVPAGQEHVGRALNQDVLRFVLRNHRVMLQLVTQGAVSAPGSAMGDAVQQSQRDAILAVFPVETYGKDGAPVIEVSRLFATEVGDFSARAMLRGGLDASRSYVDKAKAFPGSLRVDAVHTYVAGATPTAAVPGMPVMPQIAPPRSLTLNVAYSIVQLPEQPMRPRLFDDRVGFISLARTAFGSGMQEVQRERLITRWRLEKKEPEAAISEPLKPIVWYIDKATPAELVPYVKKGVEAWNSAFEAAGFRNAVQARTFPSAEEDPEFDPEDVRYSLIRWVPSPIPNAYGPHLADPRSGEILNANVVMFHNIVQLLRDWYVTQVGPLDPRAQQLPLPDELMGDLVAMVVTHEVGHALGFPHNMKASSLYPVDKLRDPEWLKTMGHTPSIMDYARFNYVAQPEDRIPPALLIPKIGPYDVFAVKWGYTPIPSAQTPEAERQQLNLWAREQQSQPWLRFSAPKAEGGDAGDNMEAVGDADPVRATGLGLRNLQRVVKMLPALVPKDGGDDRLLEEMYRATWMQWTREIGHVAALVGGYTVENKHNDQPGAIATPLPRAQQARAMKFLAEHALATPAWMLDPGITQRLRASERQLWVAATQRSLLRQLLDPTRSLRLLAQESQLGAAAYRLDELLGDLRRGVFGELAAGSAIAAPRRSLQRLYVDTLIARLNFPGNPLLEDGQPAMRAELRTLKSLIGPQASAGDATRRAHLQGLVASIDKALDPSAAVPVNPLAALQRGLGFEGGDGAEPHEHDPVRCWPGHGHGELPAWWAPGQGGAERGGGEGLLQGRW